MSSASTYARGRPVYGGGSYAPNVGAVSAKGAQGYLKRELSKQGQGPYGGVSTVGSDGKSDTRSGVAQAALSRQASGGINTPITPPKNGDSTASPPSSSQQPSPSTPSQPSQPSTPSQPSVPTPPQVIVTPSGQLQLPYDQQFSSEVLAALDQYNAQLLDLNFDHQEQTMEYTKSRRDAGLAYEDQKRATLSGNAARGTAFSSQYGTAVGRNAQKYQNTVNDMDSAYSLFNQRNALSRAGIQTAFQRMLAQAALNYGNDLSEDAGDLGLTPDPTPGTLPPTSSYNAGGTTYNIPVNWSGGNFMGSVTPILGGAVAPSAPQAFGAPKKKKKKKK